ncbi:MAG: amidase [Gammaproteobacteria bacterium]|nr:amidase [Gammaproteobacteria bacterium]
MKSDDPNDLAFKPIHELSDLIWRGVLKPVELTEVLLDRIARYDDRLHSFVECYADDARRAAQGATSLLSAGHRIGPLHGIPVAVKDIIDIEGRVTTGGSMHWEQRISPDTATLVRRMVSAGMIVLGKTHTVEFAMGGWGTNQRMGTPRNPWDNDEHRAPGGSSAGSGVAVAAGLSPCAIGTDTGGSVRLPSAWCGLTGLKTTVGRISTFGVLPLSTTLDTPGPMTRCVEDTALLYDVLQGADPRDSKTCRAPSTSPLKNLKRGVAGMRLAVMPASERDGVDPEVLKAFDVSVDRLAELGAEIVHLNALPLSFADFADLTAKIIYTEGYYFVGDLCERRELPLDEDVRPRILTGKQYSATEYFRAVRAQQDLKQQFRDLLEGCDAMLTPGAATVAPIVDTIDQNATPAMFTRAVNFLEFCALVLPNGFSDNGLPTSLQIICKDFEESTALRIGWAYEQATNWNERRPHLD